MPINFHNDDCGKKIQALIKKKKKGGGGGGGGVGGLGGGGCICVHIKKLSMKNTFL